MQDTLQFEVTDNASAADLQIIEDGLNLHAFEHGLIREPLYILSRNEKGEIAGGLSGWIGDSGLYIKWLWVRQENRRSGLGGKLMKLAEKEARDKACKRISVDTMSYQAPAFYRRFDYLEVATIKDFIRGHDRIFFEKKLNEEAS